MLVLLRNTLSDWVFMLGYKHKQKWKIEYQLFNLLLGKAKIAIYLSRIKKDGNLSSDAKTIFIKMVKATLKTDYRLTNNLEEFINIWSHKNDFFCLVMKIRGGLILI